MNWYKISQRPTKDREPRYRLEMHRGERSVVIGWFWHPNRAEKVADNLGWNSSWEPIVIDTENEDEDKEKEAKSSDKITKESIAVNRQFNNEVMAKWIVVKAKEIIQTINSKIDNDKKFNDVNKVIAKYENITQMLEDRADNLINAIAAEHYSDSSDSESDITSEIVKKAFEGNFGEKGQVLRRTIKFLKESEERLNEALFHKEIFGGRRKSLLATKEGIERLLDTIEKSDPESREYKQAALSLIETVTSIFGNPKGTLQAMQEISEDKKSQE